MTPMDVVALMAALIYGAYGPQQNPQTCAEKAWELYEETSKVVPGARL